MERFQIVGVFGTSRFLFLVSLIDFVDECINATVEAIRELIALIAFQMLSILTSFPYNNNHSTAMLVMQGKYSKTLKIYGIDKDILCPHFAHILE